MCGLFLLLIPSRSPDWVRARSQADLYVSGEAYEENDLDQRHRVLFADAPSRMHLPPAAAAGAAAVGSDVSSSSSLGRPEKYKLHVRVRDTGMGISPAQMQTLFSSFSQVAHGNGEYGGVSRVASLCFHLFFFGESANLPRR